MQYQTTTQVRAWNPLANPYTQGGPLARLTNDGGSRPPAQPDRGGGGGGEPFGASRQQPPACPLPAWVWIVLALAAVETVALLMTVK